MKKAAVILSFAFSNFLMTSGVASQDCIISDIEEFSKRVAVSFSKNDLSGFGKENCIGRGVRIVIEHSISDEVADTQVDSIAELESWLSLHKSKEGFPSPGFWPLLGCEKGLCVFSGNQMHNLIFLKKIHYRTDKDGPVISAIFFEDGD
jgi:hypothetical protein